VLPKTIRYYEQIRYRAGTCFALPLVTVTTIDQHLTDSSSSFCPLLAVSPNSVVVTEPEFRWPSVRNSMASIGRISWPPGDGAGPVLNNSHYDQTLWRR
jgi:hypothetical protein